MIAPLVNSFTAQELGDDYGDYYLATGARVTYTRPLGARGDWNVTAARERVQSLAISAAPATGAFRPNPLLGGPDLSLVQIGARRKSEGFAVRRDLYAEVTVEGGRVDGGTSYARIAGAGHVLFPVASSRVLLRVQGGAATADLPSHRTFVLGGRGTLLGDDFRSWGGRRALLVHAEWRAPIPFLSVQAGPYARSPGTVTLAPYIAAGWSDRPVPGTPWQATPDGEARVTLGLGVEWLGVFRFEGGVGLQSRRTHFAFDVTRDLWGIL